jgi:hypothetical protein
MEIFFPQSIVTFLEPFRQAFTAPSFVYFQAIVWAFMLVEGRKCVTHLARTCFFYKRDLSSWERFLSTHRWSLSLVRMTLIHLMISRLQEALWIYGAYLCVVDTTLIQKSGHMLGTQTWHNHNGNVGKESYLFGHHWGVIGLISKHGDRFLCWPVMLALIPGLKAACQWMVGPQAKVVPMTFWDATLALIWSLQIGLPLEISLRVVADAYFSKAPFINALLAKGQHLISRLRYDAVAKGDPLPEDQKPRGRKRKYGRAFKLAKLLKTEKTQTVKVHIYGKDVEVEVVVRDVWIRGVKEKIRVVVLAGRAKPILLMSTDRTLTAAQIIEIYSARFSVELCIRELKQDFGLGDYQASSFQAIYRFVHLCCVAFCVWRLALVTGQETHWVEGALPGRYISETQWSFKRIRRSFRQYVIRGLIYANSADHANFKKLEEELQPLLEMFT